MTTATCSEAFFANLHPQQTHGSRWCLWHAPAHSAPAAVAVYVHPFAEEMNKARRMAAWQARALATAGCAVLQVDLHGCGDSAGDFADASWQGWRDDVDAACTHALQRVQERWPDAPAPTPWLWGLRAGVLLAADVAASRHERWNLLLWQPQANGKQALQQFLRLKAAAAMAEGEQGTALKQAREALAAGATVDVAGYGLAGALAQGVEAAQLATPRAGTRTVWIELSTREPAELLPASATRVSAWRDQGLAVHAEVVAGAPFWSTVEIEDAPRLVPATVRAVMATTKSQVEAATTASVQALNRTLDAGAS